MAVIFSGMLVTGCVTKHDVEDLQQRLQRVEDGNRYTQDAVARMDLIITAGAEADNRLRVDLRTSVDDIGVQIAQLLENYNELVARLDQLARRPEVIRMSPTSSPGSQEPTTGGDNAPTQAPAFDCIGAYDDAFILVRKSDYENAIAGFRGYLESCTSHENTDNAHYWIGECYYAMEQFEQAVTEFQKLIDGFPGSRKLAPALYKLARSHQELGHKEDARKLYDRIIAEHDGTLEAEQARERLKDL